MSSRSASTSEGPVTAGPAGGRVVVVATPIGNLGDLSPRAVDALASADYVYCEDTRRTLKLLQPRRHFGPAPRLTPPLQRGGHDPGAVARAKAGATIAIVTDAGTPLVSDPGARLVRAALAEGIPVEAVPGPSAPLAALVVSGLATERWCFEGFLPRSGRKRTRPPGRRGGRGRPGRRAFRVASPAPAGPRRPRRRVRAGAAGSGVPGADQAPRGGVALTDWARPPSVLQGVKPRGEYVIVLGPPGSRATGRPRITRRAREDGTAVGTEPM